jgi:Peptidase_C39 like family
MNSRWFIISIAAGCWPSAARLRLVLSGALIALLWSHVTSAAPEPATALLTFARFTNFTCTANAPETVLTSPELDAGFAWNELIVSWNCTTNVALTAEARAIAEPGPTRWFNMGRWSANPVGGLRTSVNDQRDNFGRVETDTLVLAKPARKAQVRITLRGGADGLKFLAASFANTHTATEERRSDQSAWGRTLEVPVRSQADYPEGVTKWCSPTSTTMLLAYWARELRRPELEFDVRATVAGVFDPGWDGTGNWAFNMAFAGAQPELRACVARLTDVTELEAWTARGFPAAVSVSYAMLKGGPRPESGDGHLVVVCGFTAEGDVVVNDPGVRRERVRRVFPRADFVRAWERSHRTVYLVWPEGRAAPHPVDKG